VHAGSGTTGLATVQVALEGTVTFGVCVHPCPSYSHGRCRSRPISRWGAAHERGSEATWKDSSTIAVCLTESLALNLCPRSPIRPIASANGRKCIGGRPVRFDQPTCST
jgi:hypothetical protein